MQTQENYIISLVRSVLKGEPVPPMPHDLDIDALIKTATQMSLKYVCEYALESLPELPEGCRTQFIKDRQFRTYREAVGHHAVNALFAELSQQGFDVLPLKGYWIKELYPMQYMRTMGDLDILVREEQYEEVKRFLSAKGMKTVSEGEEIHHSILTSKEIGVLELHHRLTFKPVTGKAFFNVWPRLLQSDTDKHLYRMCHEDFLAHHIYHMYKHFVGSGAGIRPIIDAWIYLEKHGGNMDLDLLGEKLDMLKLRSFADCVFRLGRVWMNGEEHTENTRRLEEVTLSMGCYGSQSSSNEISMALEHESDSKLGFALKKLFPPLKFMQERNPVLVKAPVLLPLFWVIRIFQMLFSGRSRGYAKAFGNTSSHNVETIRVLKKELKLPKLPWKELD